MQERSELIPIAPSTATITEEPTDAGDEPTDAGDTIPLKEAGTADILVRLHGQSDEISDILHVKYRNSRN